MVSENIILETRGLTKAFGGLMAVDGIDFILRDGELRAIIGPNGAGKTTFFNLITGRLSPTRGRVYFKGEDITSLTPNEICQKGIARTFQITSIFPNISVYDNIWAAAQAKKRYLSPFIDSFRLKDVQGRVDEILRLVRLGEEAREIASNLSHGDQRLLEIAIGLATNPDLLLLDEPTAGMGLKETKEIVETIRRLSRVLTIVIVEHDMSVVMELAHTISVFDLGRVIAEGPPEMIKEDKRVQEVYLGVRQ